MLSHCWERAGGVAQRRDIPISQDHDFFKDDDFWKQELKKPAKVYSFAPECKTFSVAHTTPTIRSLEYPLGLKGKAFEPVVVAEITWANLMVSRVVTRCLNLLAHTRLTPALRPLATHSAPVSLSTASHATKTTSPTNHVPSQSTRADATNSHENKTT